MLKPWVAALYVSFLVLSFFYFDKPIAQFFYEQDLQEKLPVIVWLTHLGTGEVYVAGLILLALFYRYICINKASEMRSWFVWLCVVIPYFLCGLLKICFGRARPEMLFDKDVYGFYGFHIDHAYWSFPSGHASTIVGLMLGLMILFPRYCYAFFFSGVVMVSTRILLTHHYLSDVLTTFYLTLLEVALLCLVLRDKSVFNAVFQRNNLISSS